MTDTARTIADLLSRAPDNTDGEILPQLLRDFMVSALRDTFWFKENMTLAVPNNTYVFVPLAVHTAENDPAGLRHDANYVSTYWGDTLPGYFNLDPGTWDIRTFVSWSTATPNTGQMWATIDYVEDPLVGTTDPQTLASGSNFGNSYREFASLAGAQSLYQGGPFRIAPNHDGRMVPYLWQNSGGTITVTQVSFYFVRIG